MKRIVFITGTSRGIGLALAQWFVDNGYQVIGTSRQANGQVWQHPHFRLLPLDLADEQSINSLAAQLQAEGIAIDLLINNAGVGPDLGADLPDAASFDETFATNVRGTVLLTEALLPHLNEAARIIHVSSKMGSIGMCVLTDSVAYRMSKAALNMYTRILANRLAGKHHVATVHPGWVRTTIGSNNNQGRLSPQESAAGIAAFALSDFKQGMFWDVETGQALEW